MVRTQYTFKIRNYEIILAQFCRNLLENSLVESSYYSWFGNPEVTRHNSHGLFPKSRQEMHDFLDSLDKPNQNMICYAILVKETNPAANNKFKHIGNASLQSINWVNRSAEFAIMIGEPSIFGKGIGKQVCRTLLVHGFEKLNLNRIWTGTAATNIGMQKVAKDIGMIEEGYFRDGMFLNGEYVGIHCYSMLAIEYFQIHKPKEIDRQLKLNFGENNEQQNS